MPEKTATVYYLHRGEQRVPMLRLTGKWLAELGFHIGGRYTIESSTVLVDQAERPEKVTKRGFPAARALGSASTNPSQPPPQGTSPTVSQNWSSYS